MVVIIRTQSSNYGISRVVREENKVNEAVVASLQDM